MFVRRYFLPVFAAVLFSAGAWAQPYAPAINAADLMNLHLYPASGGFLIESVDLVFPPTGEVEAELRVLENGQPIATVPLLIEPVDTFPAFASVRPNGVPGGAIVPHPRSALSHSPNPDFLTPRMVLGDRSNHRHYLADVFWLDVQ